jgi:hypothetical protein
MITINNRVTVDNSPGGVCTFSCRRKIENISRRYPFQKQKNLTSFITVLSGAILPKTGFIFIRNLFLSFWRFSVLP